MVTVVLPLPERGAATIKPRGGEEFVIRPDLSSSPSEGARHKKRYNFRPENVSEYSRGDAAGHRGPGRDI